MLKKDSILAMGELLRIDKTKLAELIDVPEEKDVVLPKDISVFTATELTSREDTLKSAATTAGIEIAVKELKKEAGLDYTGEGSKDYKKFLNEYKAKTLQEANIDESTKVKEKDTIIEGLRTNLTTLQSEMQTKDALVKTSQLDTDILTMTIEKKPDNLTNKEWVAIIKMSNDIVEQDGQLVVKRDGKIVANATDLKPVPVKDALVAYIDERKLGKVVEKAPIRGRNGDDSKTGYLGIANMKQFNDHLKEQDLHPGGQQAQTMLKEITDANKDFDFKTTA